MWKTWLIAIALLVVMTLGGLVIGYFVGEAACDDPYFQTYPDFRCADEDAAGSALGFGIGLLVGGALALLLVRRVRRRQVQ
jgi:hypothetical protein